MKSSSTKIFHNTKEMLEILQSNNKYDSKAFSYFKNKIEKILNQPNEKLNINIISDKIIKYALSDFGPVANIVFEEWGIFTLNDVETIIKKFLQLNNKTIKLNSSNYEIGNSPVKNLFDSRFKWIK